MKKIYLTLIILITAMLGMAYLYFSKLNRETSSNESSLHAATANSGLVFCIQNDKSIFEILKGQDFFQKLIGAEKFAQIRLLKDHFTANPAINGLIAHKNIFISFSAGKNKGIDYLISTQLNDDRNAALLLESIKSNGMQVNTTDGMLKLTLKDSTTFYLAIEKNLVLLSNAPGPVSAAMPGNTPVAAQDFTAFIKSSDKLSKNSVGNLYIDFSRLPVLLKSILPGSLGGGLSVFANQHSFSALNYNFSRERLFFNGNSRINDKKNYLSLYTDLEPQKNSIDNLLPESTANFSLFSIPGYTHWRESLRAWFALRKEDAAVKKIIATTNSTYRLNIEEIFPRYFKDQLICFQLKSAENIGAVNLTNGDKVAQLLLDISGDYDQDIKKLKISGLLYCYFGEPLKKFSSPYYTIIDNYMVFSNQPGALQIFLTQYRNNKLLINDPGYVSLYSQIRNSANVTWYVNQKNSVNLARNTLFNTYYEQFTDKRGLGNFSSFIYQLSGDKGNFQTNCLINTVSELENKNLIAN